MMADVEMADFFNVPCICGSVGSSH